MSLSIFRCSLANYDLVITTYNIVGVEGASCEDDDGVGVCLCVCMSVCVCVCVCVWCESLHTLYVCEDGRDDECEVVYGSVWGWVGK